ncbi:MAG: copper transport protein [Frankiaceae bacterium]|nr:copper transport protein [Frankiaceae bacterium]
MRCDEAQEVISARLDGEPIADALLDNHLRSCEDCSRWALDAHQVTRRFRLLPAPQSPDLSDRIVAAFHADTRWRATTDIAPALGLAYLVAGRQPFRAGGLLPFAGILAGLLALTAGADLLAGRTSLADEAPHLLPLAGVLLLWRLVGSSRPRSPSGTSQPPRIPAARPSPVRRPTASRHPRRLLAVVVGTLITVPLLAGPASAHASLRSSNPGSGAVLQRSADAVTLQFDEPVTLLPNGVRVLDSSGQRVDRGNAAHDGSSSHVQIGLRPNLSRGSYLVDWRVTSADSHPIGGGFAFAIGAPGALASSTGGTGGDPTVGLLLGLGRLLTFVGLALLVGGTAFTFLCWPAGRTHRGMRRVIIGSAATIAAAALAGLVLQGSYATGLSLVDGLDAKLLRTTLDSPYGTAVLLRLALLALGTGWLALLFRAGAGRVSRARRAAGGLLGLGLLATLPLGGHANTGSHRALALLADTGHLASMSLWLGGLAVLSVLILRRNVASDLTDVVARFSRVAFCSVLVLVATGVLASLREVGSADALFNTDYGKLLAIKLELVLVILAIASFSRSWVRRVTSARRASPDVGEQAVADERELVLTGVGITGPAAARGAAGPAGTTTRASIPAPRAAKRVTSGAKRQGPGPTDLRALRRSVLAETVVAVVILAVTAVLVVTKPAKTVAVSAPTLNSAETRVAAGPVTVVVETASHAVGQLTIRASTYNAGGVSLGVPEVTGSLRLAEQNLGPVPLRFIGEGPGHFAAVKVNAPLPGTWTLTLSVRVDDFNAYSAQVPIHVG